MAPLTRDSVMNTDPSSETDGARPSAIDIDACGDVALDISHESAASTRPTCRYRVSLARLRSASRYFAGLLGGGFGESETIAARHADLARAFGSPAQAPTHELPVVAIRHVGRISAVKSTAALCQDLLLVLHGKDPVGVPPVANLANLAIVADRFDALAAVRQYAQRTRIFRAIDGRTAPKAEQALVEEKARQRLLAAALLDDAPWLERYSARLVTQGWVGREADEGAALWWDLPAGLEEELAFRRRCLLETLQATLSRLLALYTSRERQCRLGYDSSAACDSYQLGEMVRFFARIGTLRIQGTVWDTAGPAEPYAGDVFALVESMRQVSEYQIDRNHRHCGVRTKLLPVLDVIMHALQHTGICAECWSQHRRDYAWTEAKRPLMWKRQSYRTRGLGHHEQHAQVRSLFTASEREWI